MSVINKKSKIKKPSEIKVEKAELKPLGAYVNDRVELIRQVFSCLKSKYIKSICPEVLAGRSIQEIQECCLDELLGISKKRLIALLNATNCPSDTDSSSENGSDQDSAKEYISLEEISSDEEMNEKSSANMDNKEISVLELLELQARARAIRSQLALEPVTKIELDSENEDESNSSSSSSSKANAKHKLGKPKKKVKRPSDIEKMFAELDNNDENEVTSTQRLAPQPQPIRLKRNFLKREYRPSATVSDDKKDETNVSLQTVTKTTEATDKIEIESKAHIEQIDEAGYSSPDIITVVQSPETYSITDSEDEKENEKNDSKVTTTNDLITTVQISPEFTEKKNELPEEGEIVEECDPEREIIVISENTNDFEVESEKIEKSVENKPTGVESKSTEPEETSKTDSVESEQIEIDLAKRQNDTDQNIVEPNLTVDLADEELDYELKDDSEAESDKEGKSKKIEIEKAASETIEVLESSEDESSQSSNTTTLPTNTTTEGENANCQSFHERWLGSKKVSKILATSRLGNRLRGNIKSKKAAERALNLDSPTNEQTTEKQPELLDPEPVDYDVDSVEHYKNLVSNADKNELSTQTEETKQQEAAAMETEKADRNQEVIDEVKK